MNSPVLCLVIILIVILVIIVIVGIATYSKNNSQCGNGNLFSQFRNKNPNRHPHNRQMHNRHPHNRQKNRFGNSCIFGTNEYGQCCNSNGLSTNNDNCATLYQPWLLCPKGTTQFGKCMYGSAAKNSGAPSGAMSPVVPFYSSGSPPPWPCTQGVSYGSNPARYYPCSKYGNISAASGGYCPASYQNVSGVCIPPQVLNPPATYSMSVPVSSPILATASPMSAPATYPMSAPAPAPAPSKRGRGGGGGGGGRGGGGRHR